MTDITLNEFFSFKRHPFAETYRLQKPFLPKRDEQILRAARSLLHVGKSFALCGPSGAGKSTFLRHLIQQMDQRHFQPYVIPYGGYNRGAIHRLIAEQMGVDPGGRRVPLLHRLQHQLRQLAEIQQAKHPIFVFDDAQLLEPATLLDLCALMAGSENTVAASVILVADPTFPKMLSLRVMAPIQSRLTSIFHIQHLTQDECACFLTHRLTAAGASPDLFEPEAVELMAAETTGNRRHLMNMATMLLQEAHGRGEQTVSAQLVLDTQSAQPLPMEN